MAINFIVFRFDKPVSTENDDILLYLGLVEEAAGKQISGKPLVWDLSFDVPFPFYGRLFRLLDEHIDVKVLTVIFEHAMPEEAVKDELFVKRRTQELQMLLTQLVIKLDAPVGPDAITSFIAEGGTIGYDLTIDLEPLLRHLSSTQRESFAKAKETGDGKDAG